MAVENIFRILKSIIAGRRPASNIDHAGLPFVNFADKELGVIDTAGLPVDLLAVRHYSALALYKADDLVAKDGIIYRAKNAVSPGGWNIAHWGHVTTLKLGETATTAYRGDRGKANRDDINTMSVTKYDPTKAYSQDDMISIHNGIWRAIVNTPAGVWDETKWKPVGIQVVDKDVTVTIGTGGDFPNLLKAIEHFGLMVPLYLDTGITVNLVLKTGYVITKQIVVKSLNMGWLKISSQQGKTRHIIDSAGFSINSGSVAYPKIAFIAVLEGGVGPYIDFGCEFKTRITNQIGIFLRAASINGAYFEVTGAGTTGINATTGSQVNIDKLVIFSNGVIGLAVTGSIASCQSILCNDCGDVGLFVKLSSLVSANTVTCIANVTANISVTDGSALAVRGALIGRSGAKPSKVGILLDNCSHVSAKTMDAFNCTEIGVSCRNLSKIKAITLNAKRAATGATPISAIGGDLIINGGSQIVRKNGTGVLPAGTVLNVWSRNGMISD